MSDRRDIRDEPEPASSGLLALARLIARAHTEARRTAAIRDWPAEPDKHEGSAMGVPERSRPRPTERRPFQPVPKKVRRNGSKRKEQHDV